MKLMKAVSLPALIAFAIVGCARDDEPKIVRGYRYVFKVHWHEEIPGEDTKAELVKATKDRLQSFDIPSRVRLLDDSKLEVKLPELNEERLKMVRQLVPKEGKLAVLIVAHGDVHKHIIDAASAKEKEMSHVVYQRGGWFKPIGFWAKVGRTGASGDKESTSRVELADAVLRDAKTKERIDPADIAKHQEIEVLLSMDDVSELGNEHLERVRPSVDHNGNPSVAFEMTGEGAELIGGLTKKFRPQGHTTHRLAFLMDGEVISAPTIMGEVRNHGEITGKFTHADVQELAALLSTKPLPAVIETQPVEEGPFEE